MVHETIALAPPHSIKAALAKLALGAVAVSAAVAVFLFWAADPLYLRAHNDRQLMTVFQAHRETFERLRQMTVQDMPLESYFSESHLDKRMRHVRWQEYKRLLSEIRSGVLVGGSDFSVEASNRSVRFVFAQGSQWTKGLEYLPGSIDREGVIAQNLDRPSSLLAGEVYLRQIAPNWFIVFQKTD